jgi:hypothetical protein
MSARGPDFIIIGAMKCGTSSLHAQLAQRPALFLSTPKEPCFFSDDDQYARGLGWYTSLFAEAAPHQLCGESSTHYTKLPTHPHSVARLAQHFPRVKLVYVMRHPIDRIVSQYIHEWSRNEIRGTISEAVRQHPRYLAYSRYALQLEPYLEAFGREALLPVFFERMLAHPDQELERVCRFVGDSCQPPARWSKERGRLNASHERMRASPTRDRLLRLPGVRALTSRLPAGLREGVKSLWKMRERPQLEPQLRGELEAQLDEDLKRLGDWLGAPLSCGGWREQVLSRPLDWARPAGEGS